MPSLHALRLAFSPPEGDSVLFDPARHQKLQASAWDEEAVRRAIRDVVARTEAEYTPGHYWRPHPMDLEKGEDATRSMTPLYMGAGGVIWALHYLEDVGAVHLERNYRGLLDELVLRNRAWLGREAQHSVGSYLMGDLPFLMMALDGPLAAQRKDELTEKLTTLILSNLDHPARELMWGSPGSLLAAHFLHRRLGGEHWAGLYRQTAKKLWSQLLYSPEYACHYWEQELYGSRSNYLDAVHGFVATAVPLIAGRDLLSTEEWEAWAHCIVDTVSRTATREGKQVNWRAQLTGTKQPVLMQYCHGAPGFVVCLGGLPGAALDELLLSAGETVWVAGPLAKGSNLCHGTGGNGYAFLKLYERTRDAKWLTRARAFAMHGISQMQESAAHHGQLRHSLWTGDQGFAIYLWDCLRGKAAFPTLDVFFQEAAPGR